MNFNRLLLIFCNILVIPVESAIKFTNIKCDEFDKSYAKFEKCELKLIKRGVAALDIHVNLLEIPANNASINLQLLRKSFDYRPFMYNITTDFCGFMRNRKRFPFLKIFFDLLLKESNINHTCPYNHDIIVHNLVLKESMFQYLPLPTGEYMFRLKVAAFSKWKAEVKAYFDQKE